MSFTLWYGEISSLLTLYRVFPLCLGRSTGVSQANTTSQYSHSSVARNEKFVDDWDRECEKHRRTLNGTRFASSGASHQERERQNWPCIDNTPCEIQLSLVEQQQKLLNQKKQMTTKVQMPLHSSLQNGHSDTQMRSVLTSLGNKPLDKKFVSSDASASQLKSEQDLACGSDLYRDITSRGDWAGLLDVNRNSRAPSDLHANSVISGKKHAGQLNFDATEEQMRKRRKLLQRLQGSQKPSKLYFICLALYIIAEQVATVMVATACITAEHGSFMFSRIC